MKSLLSAFVLIVTCNTLMLSQGVFTIVTNKVNYSYGEIIEVKVSIYNNTDTTILFRPECIYPMRVKVKGVWFKEPQSTADGCERYLKSKECETWTFTLDPSKLGFPIKDGEQILYGSGYGFIDSVKINAPKYYGGIIEVQYNYLLEKEKRDKLFNSLGMSVIKRDTIRELQQINELWKIQNKSIDSLVNQIARSQDRFGYVNTYRHFEYGYKTITSINGLNTIPSHYTLSQNYPNPFNPETTIQFSIPVETRHASSLQHITLKVYDLLGREVATLVDEYKTAGTYNSQFSIRNYQLASGVYFYRLQSGSYSETKKLILMK